MDNENNAQDMQVEENQTTNDEQAENNQEENYIPKYTFDDASEMFKTFGINYDIESVIYLKRKGMSFSQMIEYDDYNTIFFIAAGLSGVVVDNSANSNENRAIKIIKEWQSKGYTLRMLWTLAYIQAKEVNGFFMTKDEILFMTQAIEKTKDEMSKAVLYIAMAGKDMIDRIGEN